MATIIDFKTSGSWLKAVARPTHETSDQDLDKVNATISSTCKALST